MFTVPLNGPNGAYHLTVTSASRLQNLDTLEKYYGKKRAIQGKNIPSLPSTALFNQNKGIDTFSIDQSANEFYMWHYTDNLQNILLGKPLKESYDQTS